MAERAAATASPARAVAERAVVAAHPATTASARVVAERAAAKASPAIKMRGKAQVVSRRRLVGVLGLGEG